MNNIEILAQLQARTGSADWSNWNILRHQWYDYVRYPAAGTNQLSFFTNPLGGVDPTSTLPKTKEQTNAPMARQFGQTYFIIQQIRTHLFLLPKNRQVAGLSGDADLLYTTIKNCMDEIRNISTSGVLNLVIGQKNYFQITQPFLSAPPGFGIEITAHAALLDWCKWFQQSADPEDVYAIAPAQMIEPTQTLDLTIDFPQGIPAVLTNTVNGATPALDVGVYLDGYIIRPAQ